MSQPDLDKLLPKLINLRARCEHEGLSMDFETVSEALSLLEGMRWRSVENELPELGDYSVLAYWDHGGIDMVHVEDYFKDITAGLDEQGNQKYTKYYISVGITHWTPLPALPQETRS